MRRPQAAALRFPRRRRVAARLRCVSNPRWYLSSEMPPPIAASRPVAASRSAVNHDIERRIAHRLARLRAERGWSLEALAERTGISRATLSRVERSELSPTA